MMLPTRLQEDSVWFVYEQTQAQCLLSQGLLVIPISMTIPCLGPCQYKKAGSNSNPIDIYSLADGIVRTTH